ncbi:uncharacterized protein ISCGN_013867 [Ixodes scapularis]
MKRLPLTLLLFERAAYMLAFSFDRTTPGKLGFEEKPFHCPEFGEFRPSTAICNGVHECFSQMEENSDLCAPEAYLLQHLMITATPLAPSEIQIISAGQEELNLRIVDPISWNGLPLKYHVRWEPEDPRSGVAGNLELDIPSTRPYDPDGMNVTLSLKPGVRERKKLEEAWQGQLEEVKATQRFNTDKHEAMERKLEGPFKSGCQRYELALLAFAAVYCYYRNWSSSPSSWRHSEPFSRHPIGHGGCAEKQPPSYTNKQITLLAHSDQMGAAQPSSHQGAQDLSGPMGRAP